MMSVEEQEHQEWLKEMYHAKENSALFYAKVKEYKGEVEVYQWHVNKLCEILVNSDGDEKFYAEAMLSRYRRLLQEAQRGRDRFDYYYKVSKGKIDMKTLDLSEIKKIPIGNFMTGKQGIGGNRSRQSFCCPFHNEDSPSFIWYVDQNSYHCYGCNMGGDVIDFYMKMFKVEFKEAIKELSKLI